MTIPPIVNFPNLSHLCHMKSYAQPAHWLFTILLLFFTLYGCSSDTPATSPLPEPEPPLVVDESTQFPTEIDSTTQIAWEKKKIPTAKEGRWNCQDFLKGYENWVDYYIGAIKQQAEHPLDTENLQRMAKLGLQTTKWVAEGIKCNANEAYKQSWARATEKLQQWK